MTCEKCWDDARQLAAQHNSGATEAWYRVLLTERREHPCSPREQAGQFWDDDRQIDRRRLADLGTADHVECRTCKEST